MPTFLVRLAVTIVLLGAAGCADPAGVADRGDDSVPDTPAQVDAEGSGDGVDDPAGDDDGADSGGEGTPIASVGQQAALFGAAFAGSLAPSVEEVPPLRIERTYQHGGATAVSLTVTVTNTGQAPVTDLAVGLAFDADVVTLPVQPPSTELGTDARVDATVADVVASVTPSAGQCTASGMDGTAGRVRCDIGDLSPGTEAEVVVTFAGVGASGTMPITVSVDALAA